MDKIEYKIKRREREMKKTFVIGLIMTIGIFLALGIILFIFNNQKPNFTGFVIDNNKRADMTKDINKIVSENTITKQDALNAINYSEQIINQMQENNFSTNYFMDSLIEAKLAFERARYASILRGEVNSTEKEKQEARDALRLVKWQEITYRDVLVYSEDIKNRKENAFLLLDKITVEDNNLKQNEAQLNTQGLFPPTIISNETLNILLNAKLAFSEERYNDSEKLLSDFQNAVEQERAQASTLSGIKTGAMNFFQRYWIYIIIILILALIIGYIIFKRLEKYMLKNKIKKMKTEGQVLKDLMKKSQTERFQENKISGLVYNIRMKKYEERLQEIKEELPVLAERARRFKNNRNLSK